jgi:hypothetical protein
MEEFIPVDVAQLAIKLPNDLPICPVAEPTRRTSVKSDRAVPARRRALWRIDPLCITAAGSLHHNIDVLAEILTGDRTYFHLKSQSAAKG